MPDVVYQLPHRKRVTWIATTTCNYSCSYCPPRYHDNQYHDPDYEPIIELCKRFRGDDALWFDLMGGEPTLWPNLSDFCTSLKETSEAPTYIEFSTNGSRTIRYWKKFDAPVDRLSISFHPEAASPDHLLTVLEELHQRYCVTVTLMMPPRFFNQSRALFERLDGSGLDIEVMVRLVHGNTGAIMDGYTPEMLAFGNMIVNRARKDIGLPYVKTFFNDEEIPLRTIITSERNRFKGWDCYVGIDNLYIGANGDVYGSDCRAGGLMGNVNTEVKLPSGPVKCPLNFCNCMSDIKIRKTSP